MVEHYGVISQISKSGYSVISDAAKANLESKFADGKSKIYLSPARMSPILFIRLQVF